LRFLQVGQGLNLIKIFLDATDRRLPITLAVFSPHGTMSTGVGLQGGSATGVSGRSNQSHPRSIPYPLRKNTLVSALWQPLVAKIVNGGEVGTLPGGQPHKRDPLPNRLGNGPAGMHPLYISIDQNLQHHSGMVAAGPSAGIGSQDWIQIHLINHIVYKPN